MPKFFRSLSIFCYSVERLFLQSGSKNLFKNSGGSLLKYNNIVILMVTEQNYTQRKHEDDRILILNTGGMTISLDWK